MRQADAATWVPLEVQVEVNGVVVAPMQATEFNDTALASWRRWHRATSEGRARLSASVSAFATPAYYESWTPRDPASP